MELYPCCDRRCLGQVRFHSTCLSFNVSYVLTTPSPSRYNLDTCPPSITDVNKVSHPVGKPKGQRKLTTPRSSGASSLPSRFQAGHGKAGGLTQRKCPTQDKRCLIICWMPNAKACWARSTTARAEASSSVPATQTHLSEYVSIKKTA